MRVKTWRIIDRGDVPLDAESVPLDCQCGHEAACPVDGRVIAVVQGTGVIFDNDLGRHALPPKIQCRRCGRVLELAS